jgi:hypothetical protein
MLNVIRYGDKLLNEDVISPEFVYATLNEKLTEQAKVEIFVTLRCGAQMLDLYRATRDNMHISNIADMLEKMETIHHYFDYEVYAVKRGTK